MGLVSSNLIRADKKKLANFYNNDELDLFSSYKRHLGLSKVIVQAKYYQEAWLELLIAVECLIKDVYCAVRFAIWGNKLPTNVENKEFYDRFQFVSASVVKSFGHDLRFLASHLGKVVIDLGTDQDFQHFILCLPSDGDWISLRYRNPYKDSQYKNKYELLEYRLNAILDGKLGSWK